MVAGSYGILLTPFRKDGRVDFKELEREVEVLCNTNLDGIVTCGSTSEFLFCTAEENKEILKTVHTVTGGRKKIIGGASSPGRKTTMEYLEYMRQVGVDVALVSPPYYYKYTDEEIASFYREITGGALAVNVIAYHVPGFTNPIRESVFLEFLENERMVGMKNSGQNIREISNQTQLRDLRRKEFSIITGTEEAFLPCMAAGCNGAFTAFGAIMPDYMKGIYDTFQAGAYVLCRKLQSAVLPLMRLCAAETFPLAYKLLGEVVGCCHSAFPQSTGSTFDSRAAELREKLQAEYESVMTLWNAEKDAIMKAGFVMAEELGCEL